ncbi:UNC-like C-terminal-domain-containing protein [Phakopsora pachyrhizi]|uniref:UNC-like C-terminal-domain-containing protein n=1 Tax=Phakopsora pachyrhizi TaxID=170000 RepID=A0AAV0BIP9_PHAPC|nr:UNC-like C-terminal-domain-containing protein [Phakopsora pachyrhizi]CAH7687089.1 UNC-like C-terminal-domain-containing protein [Phakopsora pachyrhizi]
MFSSDTPVQTRRKSFRAFTNQLVNRNNTHNQQPHTQQHQQDRQPPSEESINTNGQQPQATVNNNGIGGQPEDQRLPSASLILGHRSRINPRLPRPSNLPTVPLSYAYGSTTTTTNQTTNNNNNSSTSSSSSSTSTNNNIHSPSSSSILKTHSTKQSMSIDTTSNNITSDLNSGKKQSEPAHVRYARLNQRLQNTGSVSSTLPSSRKPSSSNRSHSTNHNPIPPTNRNPINIASAFEKARWAANPDQQPRKEQAQTESIESQPLRRVQSRENQPLDSVTNDPNLSPDPNSSFGSRKRRKSRRLLDPSYKYRPGDSASSDSEAGEGIADKRNRREQGKKNRTDNEDYSPQLNPPNQNRKQKRRRNSRQSFDSDDVTDSDLDTGPGIAATRPKRNSSLKSNQNTSRPEQPTRRKRDGTKRKKANHEDPDAQTDSQDGGDDRRSVDAEPSPLLAPKAPDNEINDQNMSDSEPAATFFMAKPSSDRLPHDLPGDTVTEESSRLTNLGFSNDSYDFAEEERIVKDLEVQNKNRKPLTVESSHFHKRAESSLSNSSMIDHQSNRGDSGIREIEEVLASNRASQSRPRLLPIQQPFRQKASVPPITEENESDYREISLEPNSQPTVSFGDKLGRSLNRLRSSLFGRKAFWNQLFWSSIIIAFISALLYNSYRTGDLSVFGWPWYSSRHSDRPIYSAPKEEIQGMEQLISRLTSLESTVSKISLDHAKDSNQMFKDMERDRVQLDDKVDRLEVRFEIESNQNMKRFGNQVMKDVGDEIKTVKREIEGIKVGRKDDRKEGELLRLKIKDLDQQLDSLTSKQQALSAASKVLNMGLTKDEVKRLISETIDQDRLRKIVAEQVFNQIQADESFLTRSEIGKLLDSELKTIGVGFENQLNSKVSNLKEDLITNLNRPGSPGMIFNKKNGNQKIESPEEMISTVEGMIDEALERYSNDRLSKRDFALYSGGGRVIPHLTSPTYEVRPKTTAHRLIAFLTGTESVIKGRSPVTALSPESDIGMCWPFEGSMGQIGIQLSRRIFVQEVSIEHVSKHLAFELDSAPREVEIWSTDGSERLGSGTYDPFSDQRIQTIKVERPPGRTKESEEVEEREGDSEAKPEFRSGVVVKFLSNHGNQFYSCIYRVRVHGMMESEVIDESSSNSSSLKLNSNEEDPDQAVPKFNQQDQMN